MKLTKWQYFTWGAKNHPGNVFYLVLVFTLLFAGVKNKDIFSGLVSASIFILVLGILYIKTSISVGKANEDIIMEEIKEDKS